MADPDSAPADFHIDVTVALPLSAIHACVEVLLDVQQGRSSPALAHPLGAYLSGRLAAGTARPDADVDLHLYRVAYLLDTLARLRLRPLRRALPDDALALDEEVWGATRAVSEAAVLTTLHVCHLIVGGEATSPAAQKEAADARHVFEEFLPDPEVSFRLAAADRLRATSHLSERLPHLGDFRGPPPAPPAPRPFQRFVTAARVARLGPPPIAMAHLDTVRRT